jgi:hypothetical protein
MGKGARNRRRRATSGHALNRTAAGPVSWRIPPADTARGNTPEALQMAATVADAYVMPCRATYLDDPVLTGVVEPTLLADDDEWAEPMPVLLLEPRSLLALQDRQTGAVREMRTESLVSGGLHRVCPTRLLGLPAEGWTAGCAEGRVKVRDPDGGVAVEGESIPDPAWISRAASCGRVAVLHGAPLGVRLPKGKTERTYSIRDRAAEVRRACEDGVLAGGVVEWAGNFTETFNWTLFKPGAFGLAVPIAYVPLWYFRRYGGPERFGFVHMGQPVELPAANGMVADLTNTDIDLIEPDARQVGEIIAGYRDSDRGLEDSFFRQWRETVVACEGLVVMTGEQEMPSQLGATHEVDRRAVETLRASWGARVFLSDGTKSDLVGSHPVVEAKSYGAGEIEDGIYLDSLATKMRQTESFRVSVSKELEKLIDWAGLERWVTNLWPVVCQTCRDPLGGKVDVSADGPMEQGMVVLSMHHQSCRPSGVTPPEGIEMSAPTSSFVAGCIGKPNAEPSPEDFPAMVVNPSCEQLRLMPDGSGGWRNATLEGFGKLGFVPGNGKFPPHIEEVEAEIVGDKLTVTLTGYVPDTPDFEWTVQAPSHVLAQVQRYRGLAVSIVTKALPTRFMPDDIVPAFADEEARIGWVTLVSAT